MVDPKLRKILQRPIWIQVSLKHQAHTLSNGNWHRVADLVHTKRKKKEHLLNCCKSKKFECELFRLHGELDHLQFKYFELYDSNILKKKKNSENCFCLYSIIVYIAHHIYIDHTQTFMAWNFWFSKIYTSKFPMWSAVRIISMFGGDVGSLDWIR